nr:MAG TPA: accessory regulator-like protein [Caudoviricetes sp.]
MFAFDREHHDFTLEERCYLYFRDRDVVRIDGSTPPRSHTYLHHLYRQGYADCACEGEAGDINAVFQYSLTDKGKSCREKAVRMRVERSEESVWLHTTFSNMCADRVLIPTCGLTVRQRRVLHSFVVQGYVEVEIGVPVDEMDTYILTEKGRRYMSSIVNFWE